MTTVAYKILLKPSVEKDLRKIPAAIVQTIFSAIEKLAYNPCKPPDKRLTGSVRTWRRRVGNYRIIYEFDSATETIIVHYIRHRREVYRKF